MSAFGYVFIGFWFGVLFGMIVAFFMETPDKPPSITQPDLTGEHFVDDYGNYWAKVKK